MTQTYPLGDATLRLIDLSSDLPRVRQIVAEIWQGGGYALMEERFGPIGDRPWIEWMWPSVEADLKAEPTRSFVLVTDNRIIGFCSYSVDLSRRRGTVGYNGVELAQQGKGFGSRMIQFVMDRLRSEKGIDHATVIVQDNDAHAPARRVYEKQGFEKLSGNVLMTLKL